MKFMENIYSQTKLFSLFLIELTYSQFFYYYAP